VNDQLIGRERERALLQACVTEALAGSGSLVLLAGEAGVGKTTLARRVLAGSGLEVLEGFGVQGGAPPRSVPSWRCCGRACARRGPAG
jgi:MoxR-like ATPase